MGFIAIVQSAVLRKIHLHIEHSIIARRFLCNYFFWHKIFLLVQIADCVFYADLEKEVRCTLIPLLNGGCNRKRFYGMCTLVVFIILCRH